MYFVKNNPKDCRCERHRINIPSLGWVKLKEKGYIPTTKDGWVIKSGTVSIKAGRYYVSVLVEMPDTKIINSSNEGIGIDLGLKDFAIISNGMTYKNINKSTKIKNIVLVVSGFNLKPGIIRFFLRPRLAMNTVYIIYIIISKSKILISKFRFLTS